MAKGKQDVELKLKNVKFSACFLPGKQGHFVSVLVEKGSDTYKQIGAAVKQAAEDAWPGKGEAMLKAFIAAGSQKMCFLPGERRLNSDGEPYPNTAGKYLLSASNKARPLLMDRARNVITTEDKIAELFYPGGRYNLHVSVYGASFRSRDGQQITGLFSSLKGIQFVEHGERTAGGARISNKGEFEDLGDPDNAGDDLVGGTTGADDDIPF